MNPIKSDYISRLLKGKQIPVESGIFLALIILVIVFSVLSPYFFTTANISNILVQSAITIVIASGATLVIASGGIDLSVGSVLCLSGILMAMGIKAELPVWLSIIIGLAVQNIVGDLFSSLCIIFDKPFQNLLFFHLNQLLK